MSVAVLIITHENVGSHMLDMAIKTLGFCPLRYGVVSVMYNAEIEALKQEAQHMLTELDEGDGVLVLTDMFGSTPSNIACGLNNNNGLAVVSGINLPMLIRLLNYPNLPLAELKDKALTGGQEGIMDCRSIRL